MFSLRAIRDAADQIQINLWKYNTFSLPEVNNLLKFTWSLFALLENLQFKGVSFCSHGKIAKMKFMSGKPRFFS